MAMLIIIVPAAIVALLGIAALRWGVDSRDDSSDARAPFSRVGLQLR
jgi:nitrogen fixation-related uncharacterized protein